MASLPRYRHTGLRELGGNAKRKTSQRRLAYLAVARRAKGLCELCGRAQDPLDRHHAFGRGHLPGIPAELCETPELILGICRACHDAIHGGDANLGEAARWMAMDRFAARWGLLRLDWHADSLETMRKLIRVFEAAH